MDCEQLRQSIPAVDHGIYLNTGAGGPNPRPIVDAMKECIENHGYESPVSAGMYQAVDTQYASTRRAVADLLSTQPESIALTDSTTDGISRIAGAIDFQAGDRVVRTDIEHPAAILPWRRLKETHGIEVSVLQTDAGRLDIDAVKSAVRGARLLVISSITWTHGTELPVESLVDIAHDTGAAVLVDAVQSVGQTAVDVEAWGADFVAGAGHKWLLGPFGSGFLYVRPGTESDLSPAAIGDKSVIDPFADDFEYAPGAGRFEFGSASPVPFAGLEAAIDLHHSLGIDSIRSRIKRLTNRLKDGLSDDVLLSPRSFESGFVTIDVPDPAGTVDQLASTNIYLRDLPILSAIRASVHAFNTADEIDALLEALQSNNRP